METWDAIRARRNVREFSEQPLEPEDLNRILEAGRLAPSSRNWQPWDLVVVTEPDRLRQLAEVWRGAWHVAGARAAIIIVARQVESERERTTLYFDLGQAVMSIMLAAADIGVGTGHASVHDQELAARLLELPNDRFAPPARPAPPRPHWRTLRCDAARRSMAFITNTMSGGVACNGISHVHGHAGPWR